LVFIRQGGGIINRKLLFSVLLLFGLALVFNVNYSSAAAVNATNTAVKHVSTTNTVTHTVTTTKVKKTSVSTTVGGLTLAQMKDGLSRAQKFYNTNYRLPNYVSYGKTKISIAKFQKIIATQGLKIKVSSGGTKVSSSGTGRPVYITSDNIMNSATDNARINNIVKGLRSLGINAYNMGLGPNTHITVLKNGNIPINALVVDIYGGADAGLIKEMGSSWYNSMKGSKKVFTVFWPPAKVITGLAFLVRAHDDNYDPASFKGLAHPDQYMINNGYNYIYSGVINDIVNAILYQAKN